MNRAARTTLVTAIGEGCGLGSLLQEPIRSKFHVKAWAPYSRGNFRWLPHVGFGNPENAMNRRSYNRTVSACGDESASTCSNARKIFQKIVWMMQWYLTPPLSSPHQCRDDTPGGHEVTVPPLGRGGNCTTKLYHSITV